MCISLDCIYIFNEIDKLCTTEHVKLAISCRLETTDEELEVKNHSLWEAPLKEALTAVTKNFSPFISETTIACAGIANKMCQCFSAARNIVPIAACEMHQYTCRHLVTQQFVFLYEIVAL